MQSKRLSRVFSNTTVQKHQFFGAQLSSQSNCPSSVVSVNYRALICCTCHFQSRSLFLVCFGFLCLQVSSAPNFRPDTDGEGGHLFRLTCSVVLWGGRSPANKITGVCGELPVSGPHWVSPAHGMCAFQVYTAQAPGCSADVLSKAGPGLRALPRSTPLRFRFSGTPQRCRLCWACVLCPSQV